MEAVTRMPSAARARAIVRCPPIHRLRRLLLSFVADAFDRVVAAGAKEEARKLLGSDDIRGHHFPANGRSNAATKTTVATYEFPRASDFGGNTWSRAVEGFLV